MYMKSGILQSVHHRGELAIQNQSELDEIHNIVSDYNNKANYIIS